MERLEKLEQLLNKYQEKTEQFEREFHSKAVFSSQVVRLIERKIDLMLKQPVLL